jgi:hypothetical protein
VGSTIAVKVRTAGGIGVVSTIVMRAVPVRSATIVVSVAVVITSIVAIVVTIMISMTVTMIVTTVVSTITAIVAAIVVSVVSTIVVSISTEATVIECIRVVVVAIVWPIP